MAIPQARILIVDDDDKSLASMRRILRSHSEIVTTTDPVQAINIFEHQGPFSVVISDFQMPYMNGIQLFSRIFALDKNAQRIMLTGHADLQMAVDAINHGKITAFLTKPTQSVTIRSIVSEAISTYNECKQVASEQKQSSPIGDRQNEVISQLGILTVPLTIKEKEVLGLLVKGFSNEEISLELKSTVGTVKTHVNNLFGKLGVNSRAKVVVRAIALGLVKSSSGKGFENDK